MKYIRTLVVTAAMGLAAILAVAPASAQAWKFGVMSDTQWPNSPDNKNPNVAVNVIRHINQEFIKNKVKFVIQVGDLTDKPGTDNLNLDIRATFAQDLYNAGIGFYPLRGNHESTQDAAVRIQQIFPQTQNGSNNRTPKMVTTTIYGPQPVTGGPFQVGSNFHSEPGLEGLTYSFNYNNASFVLLDQFTKPAGTAHATLDQTDIDWVGSQISGRPARTHAFVFGHKGLITGNHVDTLFGSTPDDAPDVTNRFMKYLADGGVHYYMGGHDHMYNRAIVTSPDGASKVQSIIAASNSYKFYIPPQSLAAQPWRSRETQIAQELFSVGYYIFTVDGPRVTVEHYAMPNGCNGDCDETADVTPYYDPATGSGVPFTLHDVFGYSLNGKEILVPQGGSYALTDDTKRALLNGESGYAGTRAAILSGSNGSLGKDYNGRALTKSVDTGWAPKGDNRALASDVITLWGMADSLATDLSDAGNSNQHYKYAVPNATATDTYVLSMSYQAAASAAVDAGFGIATQDAKGNWVNAVDKNTGASAKTFVKGAWNPAYKLGTYGVDPSSKTAWAVINYDAIFAVASGLQPVPGQRK